MTSNYPRPVLNERVPVASRVLCALGAIGGWVGIGLAIRWLVPKDDSTGAVNDVLWDGVVIGHMPSAPGLLAAAAILAVRGSATVLVGLGVAGVHFLLGLALLLATIFIDPMLSLLCGLGYIGVSWIWAIPARRWLERFRQRPKAQSPSRI